jgi:hypothetical protein
MGAFSQALQNPCKKTHGKSAYSNNHLNLRQKSDAALLSASVRFHVFSRRKRFQLVAHVDRKPDSTHPNKPWIVRSAPINIVGKLITALYGHGGAFEAGGTSVPISI